MPEITHTSKLQAIDDDIVLAQDTRKTMIKVDYVSMEFNMASEQLNSLKEYAIALFKHKLYFEKFTALDDISFEVKKGDVFGILGTNGSGKSTLLKIIAGVLNPTKGTCEINGNIAPLIELGAGFDMELSARENIYLNGSLLGYSKDFIEQHFNDIVEFAEVEKFLDMPMKNYSSGMIARIAFAIATVIVPEILIVDEVLSVGDFMFQQKCEDRINELITEHGVTVLIVSHSNDQIERLCNKAIWIEKGHTRIIGDASQVCNAYRVLGGRTGSEESERIVYQALQEAEQINNDPLATITIVGDSPLETSKNLLKAGWSEADTIILVPGHTHGFAVSVSGIAGYYDAPLLPYSYDDPTASVNRIIFEYKPKRLFIIGHDHIIDQLEIDERIAHDVEIHSIPCSADCIGIRTGVLAYGNDHNCWKSNTAVISLLDESSEAFSASPYCFKVNAPLLVFKRSDDPLDRTTIDELKSAGIDEIIPIGAANKTQLMQAFIDAGFKTNQVQNDSVFDCLDICKWLEDQNVFSENNVCISSKISAHWPDLIGAGAYAGHIDSPVILEDTTDLDNVADCIKFLSQKHPNRITFIGERGLESIDKRVLSAAAHQTSDAHEEEFIAIS